MHTYTITFTYLISALTSDLLVSIICGVLFFKRCQNLFLNIITPQMQDKWDCGEEIEVPRG